MRPPKTVDILCAVLSHWSLHGSGPSAIGVARFLGCCDATVRSLRSRGLLCWCQEAYRHPAFRYRRSKLAMTAAGWQRLYD